MSIVTSPVLVKANGAPVSKLEELPEGIANTAWIQNTSTSRAPLKVVLGNGAYVLSSPLTWTPSQSGRADSPIYVEAETPGGVLITGARSVSIPSAVHNGASRVTANLASLGIKSVEQLWVNGGRAIMARAPNIGSFYYVKKAVSTWNGSPTYDGVPVNMQAFELEAASLDYLKNLTAEQRKAAVLVAMQSWTAGHHRVQELNTLNQVRISPAAKWVFLDSKLGYAQRYFIENVPSALDAPGEWYFNPANSDLSYMPYDSQKSSDLMFNVPVARQLLMLTGQPALGKWVEHVHFKGIKFRYTQTLISANGFTDGQSATEIEAAILMDGARDVSVTDCEVSRVAGYAFWLRRSVQRATVSGCEIYDTGAGGVKVGLTWQTAEQYPTQNNQISNNRIHAIGFQFPSGTGIWVGQSPNNVIADNLIGDTTYNGISVGWTWGYGTSYARNNLIARNFLYNIMQGALGDGAGIYTLGVSTGTRIVGNVIKNVTAFGRYGGGAWGLYNDEGSTDIVMDSNIVVNTDNGGYVMHYGQNNTVSNNVLALGKSNELQITRSEAGRQVAFDRNFIVPTKNAFVTYGSATDPNAVYSNNVVSNQIIPGITSPKECGAGCVISTGLTVSSGDLLEVPTVLEGASRVSLPQQIAADQRTAKLTPYLSPATWWAVKATDVPSRVYEFDAATQEVGSYAAGLYVQPVSRPEVVSVIQGSDGAKCLAFKDSGQGFANAWEPYAVLKADYSTKTTTVSFTFKADATTEFIHEWRDTASNPFLSGPRVVFSASRGAIEIGYRKVANLPIGQWMTVTVASRQGANPTWDFSVRYADGSNVTLTNQSATNDTWTTTKAVFFISAASTVSNACIGKMTMFNQ
ncbi:MAG: right-handed parallel beta-helix repeat-containing protein [Aquabacterium sp.]